MALEIKLSEDICFGWYTKITVISDNLAFVQNKKPQVDQADCDITGYKNRFLNR